ncbi:MAG: NUDIX hydrolase [Gordonia sp. (in: high G+C Gram-positive bacteria)]|uniref:NUDIX hydrolase n=1 Tax=Gordonia sp. (in: high G+C Gram-positive bacteria) TaxID=84139 RepID=UPI003BB6AD33
MSPTDLENYPRPGVTVDLAALTVVGVTSPSPQLSVLVQERTDPEPGLALPGGFMRERWTVDRTVADVLERKVGITVARDIPIRLLRVFDDPDRDERTWAISLAHAASLPENALAGAHGTLVPIGTDGSMPFDEPLLFDHDQIVCAAVESLRERYEFRHRYADTLPDPDGFLTEPFTLLQLRRVHESVIAQKLHKDNFARRMSNYLEPVLHDNGDPVLAENLRGRPAALYRRATTTPT